MNPSDVTTPATSGEKLIRCQIIDPHGIVSIRFTTLETFQLWDYMMRTRHHLECRESSVSLWLPASTYEQQPNLYAHSGEIEAVNRFDFSIFDDTYHYTYTASRFVLEQDSERFEGAMLEHIPEQVRNSDRFSLEVTAGVCIERGVNAQGDQLVLGLHSGLDNLY